MSRRAFWFYFALACLIYLFGVIVGTVTRSKQYHDPAGIEQVEVTS